MQNPSFDLIHRRFRGEYRSGVRSLNPSWFLPVVHPAISPTMMTENNGHHTDLAKNYRNPILFRAVFLCGAPRRLFRQDRNQLGRGSGTCDSAVLDCFVVGPSAIQFPVIVPILPPTAPLSEIVTHTLEDETKKISACLVSGCGRSLF